MKRLIMLACAALALTFAVAAPAGAFRLGATVAPVTGNPAERLADLPADPEEYDPATHCSTTVRPGMVALVGWLGGHVPGSNWGTYRCEKWGPHEASLHAENRAVDWHLDVRVPADRAAGRKLIELLLAPDRTGLPHALARRMGVEEIIWDCGYWSMGMTQFSDYRVCFDKKGRPLKRVDPTIAHRNHIHFGLTKAGAAARTSFWSTR